MVRRLSIALIAAFVLLSTFSEVQAFDGKRKGFILGFGLGPGITSFTQTLAVGSESITSDRENDFGVQTDFRIGAGLDEQLQVYWTTKVSWFSMDNVFGKSVTISNGVGGAGVTYYFSPLCPSWYVTGGLGVSSWTAPFENNSDAWYGFGLSGGAGYEFSRHWSVDVSFTYGQPGEEVYGIRAESNAFAVKACLNVLAY